MKYKNYVNSLTGDNRIFSNKEIADMSVREAFGREKEIMSQYYQIGIPSEKELQESENVVYVNSYTRADGTEVKAHYRSKPDGVENNNLSVQKNSGTLTGGASEISAIKDDGIEVKSDTEITKFKNSLIQINNKQNANYKDARELMNISIIGPDNLENTKNFKVLSIDDATTKLSTLGIKGNYDIRTIEFTKDSSISEAVNNSRELRTQINDNIEKIKKGESIQVEFKDDSNLFRSLHNATLIDCKLQGDTISGYLYDKYDFEYQILKQSKDFNIKSVTKLNVANDFATLLQEKGTLQNYHIIVPIRIKL